MNKLRQKSESTNTSTHSNETMTKRILAVLFGLIETLLGFRLVFKLAGANPENVLINILYSTTDLVVGVFANIFTPATSNGLETTSVFEPGTLIAMVVIAFIALAISKLMVNKTSISKNTYEHVDEDQNLNEKEKRM